MPGQARRCGAIDGALEASRGDASNAPKLSDRLRQARPSAAGEASAITMVAIGSLQSRQPTRTELSSGPRSTTLMISIDQDEEDVSQGASRQRNVMAMNVSAASKTCSCSKTCSSMSANTSTESSGTRRGMLSSAELRAVSLGKSSVPIPPPQNSLNLVGGAAT